MAKHSEVKVGSIGDWVIRDGSQDVPVKVVSKDKKASGRGFNFRVRRVGADGKTFGRTLTRGSGALRRPGTPARTFGGKNPTPPRRATRKRRPAASAPVASNRAPGRSKAKPQAKPPSKKSSKPSPATPSLGSLRGKLGKAAPARAKPRSKKSKYPSGAAQAVAREVQAFCDDVDRAVRSTNGDPYEVSNAVALVIARRGTVPTIVARVVTEHRQFLFGAY